MAAVNQLNIGGSLYDINDKRNLYDLMYPVGSVYISSTNTNPSAQFGGTWTLINKYFSYLAETPALTLNTTNVTEITSSSFTRYNDRIDLTIEFKNKVNYGNTTAYPLFTFDKANWGLSGMYETDAEAQVLNGTTPVAGLIHLKLKDGTISTSGNTAQPGGTGRIVRATFYVRVRQNQMLDSACDKFFWKRTA